MAHVKEIHVVSCSMYHCPKDHLVCYLFMELIISLLSIVAWNEWAYPDILIRWEQPL
jgi:hypothetical protein